MTGFGSFDNSTSKRVLGLLEPGGLRHGEIVIKSCSSQASSEQWKWAVAMVEALLKSRLVRNTDTAKLTNIVIAGFGDRRDLVRKSEAWRRLTYCHTASDARLPFALQLAHSLHVVQVRIS